MNRIILLALLIVSSAARSQNKPVLLNNIQFVEDFKVYKKDIFVTGFTFEVPRRDGYSTNAFLQKYDPNLHLLWEVKLDYTNKSEINRIEVFNDKIYALVTHGKNTNKTSETFINLYVISLQGKIIERTKVADSSFGRPTNIIIDKNKLYFAYSQIESIYYGAMHPKAVLVEYDLKTKALSKKRGNIPGCNSSKIVMQDSRVFVVGSFEKSYLDQVTEHFFLTCKNDKISETILHTNKSEFFLDAYLSNNELIVVTTFPGVYGDSGKYLKVSGINLLNDSIKEKKIYFKDHDWKDIGFDVFSDKGTTWVPLKNENDEYAYVQINKTGALLSKMPLPGDRWGSHLLILDQTQIRCVDENKLEIMNQKMQPLSSK